MARMALNVLSTALLAASAAANTATPLISGATKPESAVQVGTSYFVSAMTAAGTVSKYKSDGTLDDTWTAISGLANPRGLTANAAGSKLWVAYDGAVDEYTIEAAGATKVTTYTTLTAGAATPNGLCLNGDETMLFATEPGWKPFPYGASGTNALVMVMLSSGTVTALFQDEAGHSPNGCTVDGNTIWMANQAHGITSYDYTTNTPGVATWAAGVKAHQTSTKQVGDGIVMHGGKVYVSSWMPMPTAGMIHECDPAAAADQCKEFLAEVACDMKLGGTDEAPVLLLPSLMTNSVKWAALAAAGTAAPEPDTTAAPTMAAATTAVPTTAAADLVDASSASNTAVSLLLISGVTAMALVA